MSLNGVEAREWVFSLSSLPGDHIVSVALAPCDGEPEAQEVSAPLYFFPEPVPQQKLARMHGSPDVSDDGAGELSVVELVCVDGPVHCVP